MSRPVGLPEFPPESELDLLVKALPLRFVEIDEGVFQAIYLDRDAPGSPEIRLTIRLRPITPEARERTTAMLARVQARFLLVPATPAADLEQGPVESPEIMEEDLDYLEFELEPISIQWPDERFDGVIIVENLALFGDPSVSGLPGKLFGSIRRGLFSMVRKYVKFTGVQHTWKSYPNNGNTFGETPRDAAVKATHGALKVAKNSPTYGTLLDQEFRQWSDATVVRIRRGNGSTSGYDWWGKFKQFIA